MQFERFLKLPLELFYIHAVFGDSAAGNKENRDFHIVEALEFRISVNVFFKKNHAGFAEDGSKVRFRFFAEVTSGTRVQNDFEVFLQRLFQLMKTALWLDGVEFLKSADVRIKRPGAQKL